MTPEMLAFVTFTQNDQSEQELSDAAFNVSGDLFPLPAGPLGFALGFESRKEPGRSRPMRRYKAAKLRTSRPPRLPAR